MFTRSLTTLFSGKPSGSQFVLNTMPHGRVHVAEDTLRTYCGWEYTKGTYDIIIGIKGQPLCHSCFELDPPGAGSESSSSSD